MLICDKRRPRTRGDTNIRPPQGGRIKQPPGLRPAPKALLRVGRHAPTPGLRPWRAFAHRAPAASVIQPEGSGHGCARWPGWSTACGCPRWTPSPSPLSLDSVFQKQGNRSVGKPQALSTGERRSLQRRRWADPGTARRAAVPPWVGSGVVHGQSGFRAER